MTVNVVGKSANTFAVGGEIESAVPALTVAFAITDVLVASRTVMSTAVSKLTVFAVTVNVEPVTVAVTGSATLLLEVALYGLRAR